MFINYKDKKIMKISYKQRVCPDGYVYDQTITMNDSTNFIDLVNNMIKLDLIILENKLDKDYEDIKLLMYLEPIKEGLNYLTCVTRNYIFNGIDIKDRNTLLIIDNKK